MSEHIFRPLNEAVQCRFCLKERAGVAVFPGQAPICIDCVAKLAKGALMPHMVDETQEVPERDTCGFVKLHLFLVSGKTFTFQEVDSFESNESQLSFGYRAQSDGMWKKATFALASVAGWSVLER